MTFCQLYKSCPFKTGFIFLLCGLSLSACFTSTSSSGAYRPSSYHYGVECEHHKNRYDPAMKQAAWDLIKKYSPEGVFMIKSHEKITKKVCGVKTEHFASFINAEKKDLNYYISVSTSVHEMAHNFTSMMPATRATQVVKKGKHHWIYSNSRHGELTYYLPSKGIVHVPNTPTWPAKLMDSRVPNALKDFTYKQYIVGQHGSNVIGVYALLDEFHAYWHDHQISERMMRSSEMNFFEPGDYLNFLYFKYYILQYLDYGREHKSKQFQAIMNNKIFVRTFLEIHDRFEKLHKAHLQFRKQHKMNQGNGRYQHRGKGIVYPGLDEKYAQLTKALGQKDLREMMQSLRKAGS